MKKVILIESTEMSSYAIEDKLKDILVDENIELKIETTRNIEPEVLVAIITSGGAAITALITSLIFILKKKPGKIILHGKSGWKIQYPSDLEEEKIKALIALVKEELDDLEKISL